jgi:hypothetical protein
MDYKHDTIGEFRHVVEFTDPSPILVKVLAKRVQERKRKRKYGRRGGISWVVHLRRPTRPPSEANDPVERSPAGYMGSSGTS